MGGKGEQKKTPTGQLPKFKTLVYSYITHQRRRDIGHCTLAVTQAKQLPQSSHNPKGKFQQIQEKHLPLVIREFLFSIMTFRKFSYPPDPHILRFSLQHCTPFW